MVSNYLVACKVQREGEECPMVTALEYTDYVCPHVISDFPSPVKCELTNEVCDKPWSECEIYQEYLRKLEEK